MKSEEEIPISDELYELSLQIIAYAELLSHFSPPDCAIDKKVFIGMGLNLSGIGKRLEKVSQEIDH